VRFVAGDLIRRHCLLSTWVLLTPARGTKGERKRNQVVGRRGSTRKGNDQRLEIQDLLWGRPAATTSRGLGGDRDDKVNQEKRSKQRTAARPRKRTNAE